MTKKIEFKTIEDVVSYILGNPYRATQRWSLEDRITKVWVDRVAGKAWEAEDNANEYVSQSDPKRAKYERLDKEIHLRMPEQKNVTEWTLRGAHNSLHYYCISLSSELGETFCGVWKTALAWPGSTYTKRVGLMTLPGLLKRLDNTEISKQVADARKSAEEKQKMNQRNYARCEVAKLAKEISVLMARNSEIIWPVQIEELAKIDEMQEL